MMQPDDTTFKLIPLHGQGGGLFAKVDPEDYELLVSHKWMACRFHGERVYAQRSVKGGNGNARYQYTTIKMHRVIMNAPAGLQVDHINGDTLDNRRCNLRLVTNVQNMWNRHARRSNTGYKGVSWMPKRKVYQVYISFNRKRYRLGEVSDPIEGALMYDAKAKEFFGEYANLNFPEENEAA